MFLSGVIGAPGGGTAGGGRGGLRMPSSLFGAKRHFAGARGPPLSAGGRARGGEGGTRHGSARPAPLFRAAGLSGELAGKAMHSGGIPCFPGGWVSKRRRGLCCACAQSSPSAHTSFVGVKNPEKRSANHPFTAAGRGNDPSRAPAFCGAPLVPKDEAAPHRVTQRRHCFNIPPGTLNISRHKNAHLDAWMRETGAGALRSSTANPACKFFLLSLFSFRASRGLTAVCL